MFPLSSNSLQNIWSKLLKVLCIVPVTWKTNTINASCYHNIDNYDSWYSFEDKNYTNCTNCTNNMTEPLLNNLNIEENKDNKKEVLHLVFYSVSIPIACLVGIYTMRALAKVMFYVIHNLKLYSFRSFYEHKKEHAFIIFDIEKDSNNPFIDDIKKVALMDALDPSTIKEYIISTKEVVLGESVSNTASNSSSSSDISYEDYEDNEENKDNVENEGDEEDEEDKKSQNNSDENSTSTSDDDEVYIHKKYIKNASYKEISTFVENRIKNNKHTFLLTYEKEGYDSQSFKIFLQDLLKGFPCDTYTFVDIRQVFMATTGKLNSVHKNKFKKVYHCFTPIKLVRVYRKLLMKLLMEFNVSSTTSILSCIDKILDDYFIFDMLHIIFK